MCAISSFDDLLAAVPVSARWKHQLHALLSGGDRVYHDVEHVALLFERHLCFAREAGFDGPADTRLTACAIAFHDCIYESGRPDNEERSASAWLEASADGDLDEAERTWVADTIRATSDHLGYGARFASRAVPGSLEALRFWMLDLDLTPFGEAPEVFDRNTLRLRAEAANMDDEAFETALFRLMRRYADAPTIYRTPAISDRFDAPARRNIARRLSLSSAASRGA